MADKAVWTENKERRYQQFREELENELNGYRPGFTLRDLAVALHLAQVVASAAEWKEYLDFSARLYTDEVEKQGS